MSNCPSNAGAKLRGVARVPPALDTSEVRWKLHLLCENPPTPIRLARRRKSVAVSAPYRDPWDVRVYRSKPAGLSLYGLRLATGATRRGRPLLPTCGEEEEKNLKGAMARFAWRILQDHLRRHGYAS